MVQTYQTSSNFSKFIKRKQRKSLSQRRFGIVILIIITFVELFLWISLRITISWKTISNTRKNVSSEVGQKELGCPSYFETNIRCFEILWNTLPRVWDVTWLTKGVHGNAVAWTNAVWTLGVFRGRFGVIFISCLRSWTTSSTVSQSKELVAFRNRQLRTLSYHLCSFVLLHRISEVAKCVC